MKSKTMAHIDFLLGGEPNKEPVIEEAVKVDTPIVDNEDVDVEDGRSVGEVALEYLRSGASPEAVTTVITDYVKGQGRTLSLDEAEEIAKYAGELGYNEGQFEDLLHEKM